MCTGGVDASLTRRTTAFAAPRIHPRVSGGSNGAGPSPLSPGSLGTLLGLGSPSAGAGARGNGVDGGVLARPQGSVGHVASSSIPQQQHHQHLLASLGLDGRHSPFTAALVR